MNVRELNGDFYIMTFRQWLAYGRLYGYVPRGYFNPIVGTNRHSHIVDRLVEYLDSFAASQLIISTLNFKRKLDLEIIFLEIYGDFLELAMHQYGNWIISWFIVNGNEDHQVMLKILLREKFTSLVYNPYGILVALKAINTYSTQVVTDLAQELRYHVIQCMMHPKGYLVLHRLLNRLNTYELKFVIEAIRGHVFPLCIHPIASQVMTVLILRGYQAQTEPVIKEMCASIEGFALLPQGCSFIRHVLECGSQRPEVRRAIFKAVSVKIIALSTNSSKESFLFLKMCVPLANYQELPRMVEAVCSVSAREFSKFKNDVYGCNILYWLRQQTKKLLHDHFTQMLNKKIEAAREFERENNMRA